MLNWVIFILICRDLPAKTLLYKALHIRKEYKLSKTIVKSHLDYANYFVHKRVRYRTLYYRTSNKKF